VKVEDVDEISEITATVTVLPVGPGNPIAKPLRNESTRISWKRSPNALSYEVSQGDELLCKTSATSCIVPFVVPKNSSLEIVSLGRGMTVSAPIVAKVLDAPAPVKIIPDVALVINFDTNKFNIDATDRALIRGFARDVVKYSYKEIDISGHTDSRGGVDNNRLSMNRARAARDYLLTLVPDLVVTIGAYADAVNVASNNSNSGMAANRRAEFRIVKY
jgi:outer membrane protein OmpA-like peptidoglycan-associated protein